MFLFIFRQVKQLGKKFGTFSKSALTGDFRKIHLTNCSSLWSCDIAPQRFQSIKFIDLHYSKKNNFEPHRSFENSSMSLAAMKETKDIFEICMALAVRKSTKFST